MPGWLLKAEGKGINKRAISLLAHDPMGKLVFLSPLPSPKLAEVSQLMPA